LIRLELKSEEFTKTVEKEVVNSGIEFFSLDVKKDYTSEPKELAFTLRLRVFYPEEGMIEVKYPYEDVTSYLRKFKITVGVRTANNPSSNLYPTNFIFHIKWNGKEYVAVQMYNYGIETCLNSILEKFL